MKKLILVLVFFLGSCQPQEQQIQTPGTQPPVAQPTISFTAVPTLTNTPEPTNPPQLTATPDPLKKWAADNSVHFDKINDDINLRGDLSAKTLRDRSLWNAADFQAQLISTYAGIVEETTAISKSSCPDVEIDGFVQEMARRAGKARDYMVDYFKTGEIENMNFSSYNNSVMIHNLDLIRAKIGKYSG